MNKEGGFAIQILIMLVTVVVTSLVIFLLINFGVISVKAETEAVDVLNANFIPFAEEGTLVVKEFKFCENVDVNFDCLGEKNTFGKPGLLYFRFVVESSTVGGQVSLVENYRVKGPNGNVLLEIDETKDYDFEITSTEDVPEVYFKDYLVVEEGDVSGTYTLELLVVNPLLNKRVTLVKEFTIQ